MPTTEQVAIGYDRVVARSKDGAESRWTRSQFEALNLLERVRLLAGGELRFFQGDQEVSPRSALSRD
jgi:hypothetical protein